LSSRDEKGLNRLKEPKQKTRGATPQAIAELEALLIRAFPAPRLSLCDDVYQARRWEVRLERSSFIDGVLAGQKRMDEASRRST
jgi:hypothetical protein